MKFFGTILALCAVGFAGAAEAQVKALAPELSLEIVLNGEVISAGAISHDQSGSMKANPDYFPSNVRTHEVFIRHDGQLYLCYLRRSPAAPQPTAWCFNS